MSREAVERPGEQLGFPVFDDQGEAEKELLPGLVVLEDGRPVDSAGPHVLYDVEDVQSCGALLADAVAG